jgi:hypothetical protein
LSFKILADLITYESLAFSSFANHAVDGFKPGSTKYGGAIRAELDLVGATVPVRFDGLVMSALFLGITLERCLPVLCNLL